MAQHVLGTGVINILADREEEMLARAAGLALSCAASALAPNSGPSTLAIVPYISACAKRLFCVLLHPEFKTAASVSSSSERKGGRSNISFPFGDQKLIYCLG